MRKNLLAVISAVSCGILVVVIPLCVWHQANFPNVPLRPRTLRQEAGERARYSWTPMEGLPITPFYVSLILSFLASMVAYVFSKRQV